MKKALFAQTSCIILSAGSSTRMGAHKALLKYDAEKTFIEKITETYSLAGIEHVIVVINPELFKLVSKSSLVFSEKVKLVVNGKPELGRFYSFQTGVKHLNIGKSFFFQNIDNPSTTIELLNELIIHKDAADVILPAFQGKTGHPVLVSKKVTRDILLATNTEFRIDEFLGKYETLKVESADKSILTNINSPADLSAAGLGV